MWSWRAERGSVHVCICRPSRIAFRESTFADLPWGRLGKATLQMARKHLGIGRAAWSVTALVASLAFVGCGSDDGKGDPADGEAGEGTGASQAGGSKGESGSKGDGDTAGKNSGGGGSAGTSGSGSAGEGQAGEPSGGDGPGPNPGTFKLLGAVQKGPFIQGSSISISVLDAELDPTGDNFSAMTTNDIGEFSANNLPAQPLGLQGEGFYYNEVTGNLSSAELTLRGFFIPGAGATQTAYINLVTHLTNQRVQALVKGGTGFAAAVAQAEQELSSIRTATGWSTRTTIARASPIRPNSTPTTTVWATLATPVQI